MSPACSVEVVHVVPDSVSTNDEIAPPALDEPPTARQDVAVKHWMPPAAAPEAPPGRAASDAVHLVPDSVSTRTWLFPAKT